VNRVFLAYQLAAINHIDTLHLRTVGYGDLVFSTLRVGDRPTLMGMTSSIWMRDARGEVRDGGGADPHHIVWNQYDRQLVTMHAMGHLRGTTRPLSRRFVRCFELIDHGYYTETLIVAFSILDDVVQSSLHELFAKRGLTRPAEQKDITRAVKEERLRRYLGPFLKLLTGRSIDELWRDATIAIEWINSARNRAAHAGAQADRRTALLSIFACFKILLTLAEHDVLSVDFDHHMIHYADVLGRRAGRDKPWVQQCPPLWGPSSATDYSI
jgi:hypothetical protein